MYWKKINAIISKYHCMFYLAKYSASIDIYGHLTFKKLITEEKKHTKICFIVF